MQMKQGEEARLEMTGDYAYGSGGCQSTRINAPAERAQLSSDLFKSIHAHLLFPACTCNFVCALVQSLLGACEYSLACLPENMRRFGAALPCLALAD